MKKTPAVKKTTVTTPAPEPVTAIDAKASADDVSVTPADVAKTMGSDLQDEKA